MSITIPRVFGGTLILSGPPIPNAAAKVRSGQLSLIVRSGTGTRDIGGPHMTYVLDDYSPVYKGDRLIPFAPIFQHKDRTPIDLTGATFEMKMVDQAETTKICTGPWTIDDATHGKAHYAWQGADVDTVGTWTLYVSITIGGKTVHADTKLLEIKAVPA